MRTKQALDCVIPRFWYDHVQPRVSKWLSDRRLADLLRTEVVADKILTRQQRAANFTIYSYNPHRGIEFDAPSQVVYHGTYFHTLARILHTGIFHPSVRSLGLGMESHVKFPAVYTADTFHHAVRYAWPCNVFGDNLYYSACFELEVQSSDIIKRHHGEVLVRPGDGILLIRRIFFFFNLDIPRRGRKCPEWIAADELLPHELQSTVQFSGGLSVTPLRPSAWHD